MLQLPAILKDKGMLSDGTRKIELYLQEARPEDLLEILKLSNKMCWFVCKETQITEEETIIPDDIPDFKGAKSEAQRMRGIIFRIWETTTDQSKPFPDYYKAQMFRLNEKLKEKID